MINPAHLHLLLNHFPIIGTAISIFVLLTGILKKSDDVKKTAILILILTAFVTIPVYLTGDKAQEMIEGNYDDVEESYIEPHEDLALYSFIAMDIAGAIGLLSLLMYRKPKILPNSFTYFILAVLLIVNGMMAYTANLGGKIHHPEIRKDKLPWESSVNTGQNNTEEKGKKEKNDKDSEDD